MPIKFNKFQEEIKVKRNKIILAVLILSTIALIFSGCGGGNPVVPPIDNGDGDEEEDDTYSLCDIGPAGGYIFYDKGYYSDGWRYLEAAPASTEWINKQWGSYGTLIGGTETGVGTGQSNTATIVTWLNSHSETGKAEAAQLCDALTKGGYDDWFLPSKDELNLMYENLKLYGVYGGFQCLLRVDTACLRWLPGLRK